MCDAISITAGVMSSIALATSLGSAAMADAEVDASNETMQDSIDAQYEAETQMVNEQFILDQQILEAQSIQEMEDSGAKERDSEAEARRMKANAKAALSGLNIGGATGLRTLGSFDIMGTELEGETDIAKQRILKQFHAGEDENQQNRVSGLKGAENKRLSNFNPQRKSSMIKHGMNVTSSTAKGAASGVMLGIGIKKALVDKSKPLGVTKKINSSGVTS